MQQITDREELALRIVKPLLDYYDSNKRVLPWREQPRAYYVWLSEIMLQQTRVEAVKPYFARFTETLPDIESLANASEEQLLKLWEGLGYYSRVRNLGKAAKIVMEEYDGVLPREKETLLKLPGIGSYTAGAISSIAYGKANPAVDGNVLRVMSRVFADDRDVLNPQVKKDWETLIENTMPKDRPGDYNQALMEIGAMVCVPNGAPKCEQCPLANMCQAHLAKEETKYPYKAPKKARVIEQRTVLILRSEDKTVLVKRASKGLLAGMYEFPVVEGKVTQEEALSYLKKQGIQPLWIQPLEEAKHIFTHKEWHMSAYMVRVDELQDEKAPENWLFVNKEEVEKNYPIPSAYAKYMKYLNITVGYEIFTEK